MPDCVYATEGWCIHDDRWMAALREVGFDPTAVSLGRDVGDADSLRARVTKLAGSDLPVLAGPLQSVTRHLVGCGARVVGLSWGYDLDEPDRRDEDITWLSALDRLIVDSTANAAIAQRAGLALESVIFLPWGVDLGVFTPDGPAVTSADLGFGLDARLVLTLRAHEPRYRVADVLEGFARVHDSNLVLAVGHQGSLTQELMNRAATLGIMDRTRFLGTVSEADLPSLLRGADVYVTASEVDGTSVTLLQAMACRAPIVASDTPGNRGWVEPNVTGWTFPVGDVEALSGELQRASTMDTSAIEKRAASLVYREADWHRNLGRLRAALTARVDP